MEANQGIQPDNPKRIGILNDQVAALCETRPHWYELNLPVPDKTEIFSALSHCRRQSRPQESDSDVDRIITRISTAIADYLQYRCGNDCSQCLIRNACPGNQTN